MAQHVSGEIDTDPPPAVQSLRSKFEQLAVEISTSSHKRSSSGGQNILLTPGSPRPRASSSNCSNSHPDIHYLRSSSSSSDLKSGTKRPPPPPPPFRENKSPSPASMPLPLLRPIPIPPVSNGGPRLGPSNLPTNGLPSARQPQDLDSPVPVSLSSPLLRPVPPPVRSGSPHIGSLNLSTNEFPSLSDSQDSSGQTVASLRNRFIATPPIHVGTHHSSRPSIGAMYPSTLLETDTSTSPSNKPANPPLSAKNTDISYQPLFTQSQDDMSDSSYVTPSLRSTISPFSNVEAPPSLPARKPARYPSTHSSDSSITESDLGPPSKSGLPLRPPPRHKATAAPFTFDTPISIPSSSSTPTLAPPPLPIRRSTLAQPDDILSTSPRLPARPQLALPIHLGLPDSPNPSPTTERKPLGSGRLPPPPTRTIALGDKLPPPRRPPSPSSDEESGDEDDLKAQMVDTLPDSSRSSRRPPVLSFREGYPEPKVHVHAFSGNALVAGTTAIVAHGNQVKIYDLAISDVPLYTLDAKEKGMKDAKITCMEFRPCAKKAERGSLLWLGTKEGHILELDVRLGTIGAVKHTAHLYAVAHIFRVGRNMVTLDESGKGLIYAPDASGEDVSLVHTQPRVVRIAEKQDFVKMLGGKLWTAARGDQQFVTPLLRTPVIRVYDILAPGNTMRSLMPMEHVGPVTTATIIPLQPDFVYVGHEEGFVSIWALQTEDGFPQCVDVVKVSTSDVLSLEGVNDKLWAGGRSGKISAYDVRQKPWLVTNCWIAHPGLPVLRIAVDHYGIDRIGRLSVVSVGRDEQLKLWDGLLGLDWVDEELLNQEHLFSKTRDLTMLLISWNCDSARPDTLTGDTANTNFLIDVLCSVNSPDIVSFGFQEVIDLESRKMAAKNVLLGSKKKLEDGGLSEKVTGAYKRWYDRLLLAMRQAMPPDVLYTVIHTESLVGLFSCIFVKQTERASLRDMSITTIKRGMGGRYGNKGGIVARFVIEDSSICFINCHLAAGQNAVRQRNADVAGMLEAKAIFQETEYPLAYVGGGDGTMVLDHEIVFVSGDMNYRIDHRRDAIVAATRTRDLTSLLAHDQLLREIRFNRACRFRGFSEGLLTFLPTYKYDPRSNEYDSSEKRRSPAWCDRVLWRSRVPSRVNQLHYRRYETNVSDHRPISAAFTVTIKSLKHDIREKAKAEVRAQWVDEQARLLAAAKQFYIKQALI